MDMPEAGDLTDIERRLHLAHSQYEELPTYESTPWRGAFNLSMVIVGLFGLTAMALYALGVI
jgi:hypothetical protein